MRIDPKQPAPDITAKLRKSAEDFTAVALDELLKPMFDGADNSDSAFGGGAAERTFKPMMITEIAKQMARSGGLGIAEPVYQQMLRLQEQKR